FLFFYSQYFPAHPHLLSFPTRRSSDLYDPYIPEYKHKGVVHTGAKELTDDMLKAADIVIICTAHACFDYDRIQKCSKEIFDTRRSEEHTSELQSRFDLVCRLLLEKKNI